MPLLHRTIKLVIATCLAIWLAQRLQLLYAPSAGIIAILSVLDTRRASLKTAWARLWSTVLALFIAVICFSLFGFHLAAFALYLLVYVPLAYRSNLTAGIAPCTVLVTHLLAEQSISLPLLANELSLFLIGAGLALLANLYMPSQDQKIHDFHNQVEQGLKAILLKFHHFLITGDGSNDASLIKQLDKTLAEALRIVYLDRHNQVFHQTDYQVHYFEMRQAQNRILQDMAQMIDGCQLESEESLILATLFVKTASQLSQTNPAHELLEAIEDFLTTFRKRPLPKTRIEFETRATLYQLLHDLERFIQLKVDFYERYQDEA
ncbi:aromatic acid exporter family protein [Streptococcus himalayensis]|uniref:Membrane protein n=1 Tax=Streptococcus himalayensis TaxID=1888195 RepID=A0A917A465_9STRE|nr:aromatic acid exporter family protein [Streptococcus himalayensis]GGE26110.1 membrane protein [Streptococcus himalayensis]